MDFLDLDIGRKIGSGRYGHVYLTENEDEDYPEQVAVKIINKKSFEINQIPLMGEVNILKRINSPFIVRFYTYYEDIESIYYVFDYVSGGDLFDKIQKSRMSYYEAFGFFKQIVHGVKYLHSNGIMHRDIKPENILIEKGDSVKIADFGLATIFKGEEKFVKIVGTVFYMAPEIIVYKIYDYRIDIWMLGVIFYEMLTRNLPFYSENNKEVFEKITSGKIKFPFYVSSKAKDIITNILKIKPEERLTIDEILEIK